MHKEAQAETKRDKRYHQATLDAWGLTALLLSLSQVLPNQVWLLLL